MKNYKMGDYEIGSPESIFTNKVCAATGDWYSCYKEEFFRWALQQSEQELQQWYKEASKETMTNQHDSSHAECDFLYLKEALEQFSTFDQYHKNILQDLEKSAKEHVERSLLFQDSLIKPKDLLCIYPILCMVEQIERSFKEIDQCTKVSVKDDLDTVYQKFCEVGEKKSKISRPFNLEELYNTDSEYNKLEKEFHSLYKTYCAMLRKEQVEKNLNEIFSILEQGIDTHAFLLIEQIHYDSEIKRKYMLSKKFKDKGKGKRLKQKFDKIDFLYKVVSEAGTRRDDMYKKMKRLAGSGWSKQK